MRSSVSVIAVFFVAACAPVEGGVIVTHQGANSPTTEGWSEVHAAIVPTVPGLGDVTVGPVFGDMGFDAWEINDASRGSRSNGAYARVLTPSELAAATTLGFKLTTRLKVANIPDSGPGINASVLVEFFTGTVRWQMAFGSIANGDPFVKLYDDNSFNGPVYLLGGTGGGYHLYELIFNPATDVADLFVDGVERISFNGRSFSDANPIVKFGSGQNSDVGRGRYSFVQFEVVPEPSAIVLVTIGLTIMFAYCRSSYGM